MTDLRHCSVCFMLQYKTYLSKAYAGSRIPPMFYIWSYLSQNLTMLYVTSLSFVYVHLRLPQSNIKDIKHLYVLWNNKLNVRRWWFKINTSNRLKKLTILFYIQGPTYNTTLIKVLECFILRDPGNRGSEHKKC